jgi:hypothetical protein
MILSFCSGLVLSALSAWWTLACQARQPWRAALAEVVWSAAVVSGLGSALVSFWAAAALCLGTGLGTWLVIRCRPRD